MADDMCSGFVPQVWKRERCKKCFRIQAQHGTEFKPSGAKRASYDSTAASRYEARESGSAPVIGYSWRRKVYASQDDQTGQSESSSTSSASTSSTIVAESTESSYKQYGSRRTQSDSPLQRKLVILTAEISTDDDPPESVSMELSSNVPVKASSPQPARSESPVDVSFRSANSGSAETDAASVITKTGSFESLISSLDTKSMVTAVSGDGSERSSTPTELDTQDVFIRSIKTQLEIMENKCQALMEENEQLRKSDWVLAEAESSAATTTTTTNADTIKRKPKSSTQPSTKSDSERIVELREKLAAADSMCQDYKEENMVLKCELRNLQESITEKSEPAEIRDLKAKLAAAESLCEEMMEENESLKRETQDFQREIEELQDQYREEELSELRDVQKELEAKAKDCRVLQFKLRKAERKCDQAEADKQHLEEKVQDLLASQGVTDMIDTPKIKELELELRIAKEVSVRLHNELEGAEEKRVKLEEEVFFYKERAREFELKEKLKTKPPSPRATPKFGPKGSADSNNAQILRDLNDALERETDLRDQLKFAEDDALALRKKVTDMETENEGLMRQLAKFTTNSRSGNRAPMIRSYSEGHAQIQLELAEHEAHVLREKLSRTESDNEHMLSQISLLEKEVKKVGGRTSFSDKELRDAIPDTYYKQKIKALEEEVEDMKFKLESQKAEADQDYASIRRGRTTSSSPMAPKRSYSADEEQKKQGHIALLEQEAKVLRQRILTLEGDNQRLLNESKVFQAQQSSKKLGQSSPKLAHGVDVSKLQQKIDQMDADIHRFIKRINDLEKEKETLSTELELRVGMDANSAAVSSDKSAELSKQIEFLTSSLKSEQQKLKLAEQQLSDYKSVIAQSENQKLITMATRVEILVNQLKAANERYDGLHRKMSAGTERKNYEDALRERVEALEKELASERGRKEFPTASISEKPSSVSKKEAIDSKSGGMDMMKELKECHDMLSTAEQQADKLYTQIEDLERKAADMKPPAQTGMTAKYRFGASRFEPKQTGPEAVRERNQMLGEVAKLKSEIDALRQNLHRPKTAETKAESAEKPTGKKEKTTKSKTAKGAEKCPDHEKTIAELRRQLELAIQDRDKQKVEAATANERLLQTEQHWSKELEKTRENYDSQVKALKYNLDEAEQAREEKSAILKERTSAFSDKVKRVQDLEAKVEKLQSELKNKHKDLELKLDTERKKATDLQLKYTKLEEIYESDRQKLMTEKEKFKVDLLDVRKRNEETVQDFDKLKTAMDRKQSLWHKEKQELESQLKKVQEELQNAEKKAARKATELANAENRKLLTEISQLRRKAEGDAEDWRRERDSYKTMLDQKQKEVDYRLDEQERLKKEVSTLKSRIDDQRSQLEDTRRQRDDVKDELSRHQQTWAKERSDITHKMRQDEKVQLAEHQALQLKYESRVKVMEDSSKRLQSQLTQMRRERDQVRDTLEKVEKNLNESRQHFENEEKDLRQRLTELQKQIEVLADVKAQLEQLQIENENLKKLSEQDHSIYIIEKATLETKIMDLEQQLNTTGVPKKRFDKNSPEKLLQDSMKVSSDLRQQLEDVKSNYNQEVDKIRRQAEKNRQDWQKERTEMQRKIKDLQESVKILEIDRRNMLATRDETEVERNQLSTERENLLERIHDGEIHQLANKYKLDKVSDQLTDLQSKILNGEMGSNEKKDLQDLARKALEQLLAVREDMGKTKELGKGLEAQTRPTKSVESSPAIAKRVQNSTEPTPSAPPRTAKKKEEKEVAPAPVVEKSRSMSTDSELSDLRGLRMRSPSPRKITNYPEAPPNMIYSSEKNAIEYDSNGIRHWKRRSMRRSISLDPGGAGLSHARSASTGTAQIYKATGQSPSLDSGSSSLSSSRTKISDIFSSLRRSSERSGLFRKGLKKSKSIESSDTAQRIGAIGVQVLPPAVSVKHLPDSLQSSRDKLDEPFQLKKSSSGRLLDKIGRTFGRKSSQTGPLPRQAQSVDLVDGSASHSASTSQITSRTTSEENFVPPVVNRPSSSWYTSSSRLLSSSSYSSVRSLGTHRYTSSYR